MERSRTRRSPHLEDELAKMLRSAIENNDEKEVENLIERGVDVNSQNSSGETPLHKASWRGNEEIVRLLLNAGANLNARDGTGETPLMKACFQMNLGIIKMFLNAGVDVNAEDRYGLTALKSILLSFGDDDKFEIIKMLIKAGAKVKLSDIELASKYQGLKREYFISDEIYRIVKNAYLRQQLTPLLSASARGQVFDSRLYDRRLWRIVSNYITKKD